MIPCDKFFNRLLHEGIHFFSGVPDSLLREICAYISDHVSPHNHVIAANEGAALSVAAGSYLATGRPGLVYLQNSGLGNLVNPLTSLTDSEVYAIPALLLIGWRGEPGLHDEPQHQKQGRVTCATLQALEVPFQILPGSLEEAEKILSESVNTALKRSCPFALLVKKGTFSSYKLQKKTKDNYPLRREDAVKLILNSLCGNEVVVSTTGMTSREVFEHRQAMKQGHARDFLTVGSMGHSSQIALGISGEISTRQVYCIDGDGALIMHMGSLAINGCSGRENFRHIVINNGAHDSVGGQPTVGLSIDIPGIAKACGYRWASSVGSAEEISRIIPLFKAAKGPALLEIRVAKGSRENLGRPETSTHNNKRHFMEYLQS